MTAAQSHMRAAVASLTVVSDCKSARNLSDAVCLTTAAGVCCLIMQRSNNTIVLILGASFLLPALVILAVAYGSGYLDALYSNTMSNMR